MKCAICGRKMLNPGIAVGEYQIGPVCAKKRGLVEKIEAPKKRSLAKRDKRTLDLFE